LNEVATAWKSLKFNMYESSIKFTFWK
jgi:hypothetical protein